MVKEEESGDEKDHENNHRLSDGAVPGGGAYGADCGAGEGENLDEDEG